MYNSYGIYTACRDAAWRCLVDFGVTDLPVKLVSIAKQANVRIVRNSAVHELRRGESGAGIYCAGRWVIVYDDTLPVGDARMVIAHELGHILLGHEYKYSEMRFAASGKKLKSEREADMFALRLLAPACVLHELNCVSPSGIEDMCLIPHTNASTRAARMHKLEARDCYYLSSLEKNVAENFSNFIQSRKSK